MPLEIDYGDHIEVTDTLIPEHQSTLTLPQFPVPGIFILRPQNAGWAWIKALGYTTFADRPWRHLPNARRVITHPRLNADLFARFLAKIAHSFICGTVDPDSFTHLLPKLILGESNNLSYLIGSEDIVPPPIDDISHHHLRCRLIQIFGKTYIVVRIRLFCDMGAGVTGSCGTPHYEVIVGYGDEQTLIAHLRNHPRDSD